jgi:hypothetical protein
MIYHSLIDIRRFQNALIPTYKGVLFLGPKVIITRNFPIIKKENQTTLPLTHKSKSLTLLHQKNGNPYR